MSRKSTLSILLFEYWFLFKSTNESEYQPYYDIMQLSWKWITIQIGLENLIEIQYIVSLSLLWTPRKPCWFLFDILIGYPEHTWVIFMYLENWGSLNKSVTGDIWLYWLSSIGSILNIIQNLVVFLFNLTHLYVIVYRNKLISWPLYLPDLGAFSVQ